MNIFEEIVGAIANTVSDVIEAAATELSSLTKGESKSVAIIVTSCNNVNGLDTGLWLSEVLNPYTVLTDKGYTVDIISINGGQAPIDAKSLNEPSAQNDKNYQTVLDSLTRTLPLAWLLFFRYDAYVLAGGHGVLGDFTNNDLLKYILQREFVAGKILGAICHGPVGLLNLTLSDGTPLIAGHRVTGFSNLEEGLVELDKVVPISLEDEMRKLGAKYRRNKVPFTSRVEGRKTNLITGQNPQSATAFAKAIAKKLAETDS